MKTSLPNSKRCSIAEVLLTGWIAWQLFPAALAAPVPARDALKGQIENYKSASFELLLRRWDKEYGDQAVQPLLSIVEDHKASDRTRYVALMGAAKLGGAQTAGSIVPHLKDRSWMIRSASLQALGTLKNPETSAAVLPLLKDPALVVRVEAVDAVQRLHPSGAAQALITVLKNDENYRMGKAQWVPVRALNALLALHDSSVARQLGFLLDYKTDPDLQRQTIAVLEGLTGQHADHQQPLPRQIDQWKKILVALNR